MMGVPKEIRDVERPANTIVVDNGRDGPKRWAVRERKSSGAYIPGRNPQPVNGGVIGHIIDFRFVPIKDPMGSNGPEELQYAPIALFHSVTKDVLEDLISIIDADDVYLMMAIAALRFAHPGISDKRLSTDYRRTFACIYYPNVPISANTVSAFQERIGIDGEKRREFYKRRVMRVAKEHHIAIDGMLKQDNSIVNDLSEYSHKSRKKGSKDISVLFAYDIELMEPICSEVFPGNMIDAKAYSAFIRDNNITKGVVVDDKGFPPSQIKKELSDSPDLHFLTPLKRNAKVIAKYEMYSFEGPLADYEGVWFKKVRMENGNFLISYKDVRRAASEEMNYNNQKRRTGNFDPEDYKRKDDRFGTIVFETDVDLDPEVAYAIYEDRWLLELVFKRYKNELDFDQTNIQSDPSTIGKEFINFICILATTRVLRKARDAGLLEKMSYGDLMDDLKQCWRKVDAPEEPANDDGCWVHTFEAGFDAMAALGLSKPVPKPEPKKRGRKPKNPVP